MRKMYMVLLATILITVSSVAQKGNNQIGVGGDLSVPTSDLANYFKTGMGVYVKGMLGVGKTAR